MDTRKGKPATTGKQGAWDTLGEVIDRARRAVNLPSRELAESASRALSITSGWPLFNRNAISGYKKY